MIQFGRASHRALGLDQISARKSNGRQVSYSRGPTSEDSKQENAPPKIFQCPLEGLRATRAKKYEYLQQKTKMEAHTRNYLERTTAHGIPRAVEGDENCHKGCSRTAWIVALLFSYSISCYYVYSSLAEAKRNPIATANDQASVEVIR